MITTDGRIRIVVGISDMNTFGRACVIGHGAEAVAETAQRNPMLSRRSSSG